MATCNVNCLLARWAGLPESLTSTVKSKSPALVGAPEITPLAASRLIPNGNSPLATDQCSGDVPPIASN